MLVDVLCPCGAIDRNPPVRAIILHPLADMATPWQTWIRNGVLDAVAGFLHSECSESILPEIGSGDSAHPVDCKLIDHNKIAIHCLKRNFPT